MPAACILNCMVAHGRSRSRLMSSRVATASRPFVRACRRRRRYVESSPNRKPQAQHAQYVLACTDILTQSQAPQTARQGQHNGTNGLDGGDPDARSGNMFNTALGTFTVDDPYHTTVGGFTTAGNGDGRAGSPSNGDRNPDANPTHEQLIADNSSLKTRVSELEVINEFFRERLSQLEQQEAASRRGIEVTGAEQIQLRTQLEASQESEVQLRTQLEDVQRRENSLKRRLDELELELKEAKEGSGERPAKKARLGEEEQGNSLLQVDQPIDPLVTDPEQSGALDEPAVDPAVEA